MKILYSFNNRGYLTKIEGYNIKSSPVLLWSVNDYNQYNEAISAKLGNNLVSSRSFDEVTNFLSEIKTGTTAVPDALQYLTYTYSPLGNINNRKDMKLGLQETFAYNGLNQIVQAKVNGLRVQSVQYDILGNIVYKSDVGSYKYAENGKGPHTLTSINNATGDSCAYNFNQTIGYSSYNYATLISDGNTEISIKYGPGRERESMITKKYGQLIQVKNYYGELYEEVINNRGDSSANYFIKNGNEVIAIAAGPKRSLLKNDSISYLLKDHLGSLYAYTDENGNIKERQSYDAWGKARNPLTWQSYFESAKLPSFQRGFTYHEMIDMDFLVCMNARVYNPILGRFLSPDPFVQTPENLLCYNRYAYVLNNPLTYTDPSGYFHWKKFIKQWGGTIVAAGLTFWSGGTLGVSFLTGLTGSASFATIGGTFLSGAAAGFGGGLTTGVLNGQNFSSSFLLGLQNGAEGGIMSAFNHEISSLFPSWIETNPKSSNINWSFERRLGSQLFNSAVRSTVSGVFSGMNGGSFKKSFYSSISWEGIGFLNEVTMSNFNKVDDAGEFKEARPTLKNGTEVVTYTKANNEYGFIEKFSGQNIGTDYYGEAVGPWSLSSKGTIMQTASRYIPGLGFHANVHDTYISILFSSLKIQGGTPLSYLINISSEVPFAFINYGVNLNYNGMLNH